MIKHCGVTILTKLPEYFFIFLTRCEPTTLIGQKCQLYKNIIAVGALLVKWFSEFIVERSWV